ncbi:MAG: hypothetical protein KDD32_11710, partial [Bacteroidetes bacterium]|nr:hypothetical protein [Bacteroidota bacterium]
MKAFFTILVVLLSGCNKFVLSSYSKKDIFTKYKEGYSTILNNSPIDIETIFLSEDNIDKIETNYKKKLIKIH